MKRFGQFILILGILMGVLSCQKSGTAQIEEGEVLGAVSVDSSAVENGGLVVYLTGTATVTNGEGSRELNIGDMVQTADTVSTDSDSYCEIQIGNAAVIRIEEQTILSMASLSTAGDKTDVKLNLASGTVLCKVEKLIKSEDSFKVQTDGAVCGVRGTQFSVAKKADGETVFAVKEGKVAVVPPAVDDLQTLAANDTNVAEAVGNLDETVIFVEASEQFAVEESTFQATEETLAPVTDTIVRLQSGEAADDAALKSLKSATDKARATLGDIDTQKEAISEEKSQQLEVADDMVLVSLPTSAGSDDSAPRLFKMVIKTVPKSATIEVDGIIVGKGSFSRVYPEGTVVNLNITEPGYEPHSFSMTLDEKRSKVQTIKLVKSKTATVPEQTGGEGTETTAVTENAAPVESAESSDKPVLVSFKTLPEDAEITVNKEIKGKGSWSSEFKNGEILEITVTRNGYETKTMNLTVGAGVAENVIQLEAKPIEARWPATKEGGIGSLLAEGDTVFFADAAGTLYAVNTSSGIKWTRTTANKPNENSQPVVEGGTVWFSGVKELAIVEKGSGKVKASVPLSGDMVHLFGSRVVPLKDDLIFPANNSLFLMQKNSGEIRSEIPIPGGTRMTPGIWKAKILIVNQKGSLLIVDPQTGSITVEIPTQAVQPVAIAVSVYKDYAIFCGRKGTVSAVDVAKESVLWERSLNGTIYNDIAVGPKGGYVYMNGTITAVGWKSGSDLFKPVTGVSCPPLVDGNNLIYVTDGNVLVIADATTGKVSRKLQLDAPVVTRPAMAGGKIVVLSGNEILVLNPEGIGQ